MGEQQEATSALARGRRAVARGDWDDALDHLSRADDDMVDRPDVVRLRGVAAYGAGRLEAAVDAFEDLYALHLDRDEHVDAARAAGTIAMYLMMDTGLMAPVRAWLGRAERLLATDDAASDVGAVHALVAMVRTYERFLCGDREAAREAARRAIDFGTRHDVPSAVGLGRTASARLTILDGDVQDGVRGLDEVAAMLLSGQLDALTTGMVWCELVCAVRGLALHDKAEQWTAAMEEWGRDAAFGGINGRCRIHRAEVLRFRGASDEAEEEAVRACAELAPWMRRELGWPLTELGTIRLRRGDLEGAERAFLSAHDRAWDPQPGLALVRLAQGSLDSAAAMVANALDEPLRIPFKERPPFGGLARAPLLDAQVEIAHARDDHDTARSAADELHDIATTFDSPALEASALQARGRVALMEDDPQRAVRRLQQSVATWVEVGAPHEAAVARVLLGDAHHRTGNDPCAKLEWNSARRSFERLGSKPWLERVVQRLDKGGPEAGADPGRDAGDTAAAADAGTTAASDSHASVDPATDAEGGGAEGPDPDGGNVFRCDGDVRQITFDGDDVLLRDLKGMRHLARLLAAPDHEFHVLDLVAAEEGESLVEMPHEDVGSVTRGGDAGPMIDEHARVAYERRLVEVEQDIDEADRMNDPERKALAQSDREFLVNELARATGLGGRRRRAGSTAERARSTVTRAIRYSIDRITEHHPTLGDHLDRTIETGTWCVYRADPPMPARWQT